MEERREAKTIDPRIIGSSVMIHWSLRVSLDSNFDWCLETIILGDIPCCKGNPEIQKLSDLYNFFFKKKEEKHSEKKRIWMNLMVVRSRSSLGRPVYALES